MPDEMFFGKAKGTLRRGKRARGRTETCRPCLVWPKDAPDLEFQGVALNLTPYGLLVRMMDALPPGTQIRVQLMRDEDFNEPLAAPLAAVVVRTDDLGDGFVDHGIKIEHDNIRREQQPFWRPEPKRPAAPPRRVPRMHMIDFLVGESETGKTEK